MYSLQGVLISQRQTHRPTVHKEPSPREHQAFAENLGWIKGKGRFSVSLYQGQAARMWEAEWRLGGLNSLSLLFARCRGYRKGQNNFPPRKNLQVVQGSMMWLKFYDKFYMHLGLLRIYLSWGGTA